MKIKAKFFCFILFVPSLAYAASFDCNKELTSVEHIICKYFPLSNADSELAEIYLSLKKFYPDKEFIVKSQLDWMKKRNQCKDAECIGDLYKSRKNELTEMYQDPRIELTEELCKSTPNNFIYKKCLKENVYNPCVEGTISGDASCGWDYLEIADDELKEISRKIDAINKINKDKIGDKGLYTNAEKSWLGYRDNFCEYTNQYALHGGDRKLSVAFCKKTLTEDHVRVLKDYLVDIEYTANWINKEN